MTGFTEADCVQVQQDVQSVAEDWTTDCLRNVQLGRGSAVELGRRMQLHFAGCV